VKVSYHTLGCKANQYDTERMRQESEARGAATVEEGGDADVCVVNSCTVTNQADASTRRLVRRLRRQNPDARIVVAGCSAALHAERYRAMPEVDGVVPGHDPVRVASAAGAGRALEDGASGLVQITLRASLDRVDTEPVGAELLRRRAGATRGWLKIQDGCDRRCSFCATRLARGASRSRSPGIVVREARAMARHHPEIVLTGIHIGHYGRDLEPHAPARTLSGLLARLLDAVPEVRFRLGSVEATEVDDLLLEILSTSGDRVASHLHMPLQSGADPVLRRMRRWHTREMYRRRALEIAGRLPVLGMGADVITGFPGETEDDHRSTVALVEELPFTYLHVFPFSPRDDTVAAELNETDPVPQRVAGERSRELRELVQRKGERYRRRRSGSRARVALEGAGETGVTGDYLRVAVAAGDARTEPAGGRPVLRNGVLHHDGSDLYIRLTRT